MLSEPAAMEEHCGGALWRRTVEEHCGGAALFQDPDFPCDDASLFSDYSTPLRRLQGKITWRRPPDISQSAALFPDNINLAHAKQGLLGDCWFLCACSFLLKNKQLLNKVLSPDQPQWGDGRYRGSFSFSFWQHGCWLEVTVDDRLPCIDAALCFSRCHSPDAFWVALLEKAYAKLRGSYERLWAGQVSEALVDLTGGLAERWSLARSGSEEDLEPEQDSDEVWRRRLDLSSLNLKDGCSLSCSTHSSAAGVSESGQFHALTITEWVELKKLAGGEARLLRIRNPWGRGNWTGAWTWGGGGWRSVDPRCAADLQSRLSDGEFWLDEAEFMSHFDDVTLGYPISEGGHLKSIYTGNLLLHRHQQAGRWLRGSSAGGSRNCSSYSTNPKFWLEVAERGEVLITLLQHRTWRNSEKSSQTSLQDRKQQHYRAIALHMWKVEKEHFDLSQTVNKPPCASTRRHAYEREVVLGGQLEPGHHLLIPSTFQPGVQAGFLIRVFSSSPTSLRAMDNPAPSLPSSADTEWETRYFRGCWVEGSTAGGSRNFQSHWQNPNFPFSVCDEPAATPAGPNVRITLQQSRPDCELLPIGFHVYKVPEGRSQEPVASCVPHCYTQDVSLTCWLPPADYTVVPSTYQPGCSASFSLSLARRTHRKVVKSQEKLGKAIQESPSERHLTCDDKSVFLRPATPSTPHQSLSGRPRPPHPASPCQAGHSPPHPTSPCQAGHTPPVPVRLATPPARRGLTDSRHLIKTKSSSQVS